jgi:hypothetical protein
MATRRGKKYTDTENKTTTKTKKASMTTTKAPAKKRLPSQSPLKPVSKKSAKQKSRLNATFDTAKNLVSVEMEPSMENEEQSEEESEESDNPEVSSDEENERLRDRYDAFDADDEPSLILLRGNDNNDDIEDRFDKKLNAAIAAIEGRFDKKLNAAYRALDLKYQALNKVVNETERNNAAAVRDLRDQLGQVTQSLNDLKASVETQQQVQTQQARETTDEKPFAKCNTIDDALEVAKLLARSVKVCTKFVHSVLIGGPILNIPYYSLGQRNGVYENALTEFAEEFAKTFFKDLVERSDNKIGSKEFETFDDSEIASVVSNLGKSLVSTCNEYLGSTLKRATKFCVAEAGTLGFNERYVVKEKSVMIVKRGNDKAPVLSLDIVLEALKLDKLQYQRSANVSDVVDVVNPFASDTVEATQNQEQVQEQSLRGYPTQIQDSPIVKKLIDCTVNAIEGLPRFLFNPESESVCGAFASTCVSEQLVQLYGPSPTGKKSKLRFHKSEGISAVTMIRIKNVRNKAKQVKEYFAKSPLTVHQVAFACSALAAAFLDRGPDEEVFTNEVGSVVKDYLGIANDDNQHVAKTLSTKFCAKVYKDALALACLVAEHQTIGADGLLACKAGCPFRIAKVNSASTQERERERL